MWSIEKGKEQSVNEKARFEIIEKKTGSVRLIGPVTMDRYEHGSLALSSILLVEI